MAELAGQIGLDFSPSPPALEERSPIPGEHLKDRIRASVRAVLNERARGREAAITGEKLAEAVAGRLEAAGREVGLAPRTMQRRCQESVAELIEAGEPIASSSRPPLGYWWAVTPEDLEESLAESDRRARMALRRRRMLRRVLLEMRGQRPLRPLEAPRS